MSSPIKATFYCPVHGLQSGAVDHGYAVICPVCNRACVESTEREPADPTYEYEPPDVDFRNESMYSKN